MRARHLIAAVGCCQLHAGATEPEVAFEITGASAGTTDSPAHTVNGKYYLGQPRFPNCQMAPCTTYLRVGEPAGSRSYQVDFGTTIGEWTLYADQSIAYTAAYAPGTVVGGDIDLLPPARGWDADCVSCVLASWVFSWLYRIYRSRLTSA